MNKDTNLNFKDLIFGSQLLRGAFNADVFCGKANAEPISKPLIRLKEEEPLVYPSVNLKSPSSPNPEFKPSPSTNFDEHKAKVREVVEMIQKNKNNYYFNMFMEQARK